MWLEHLECVGMCRLAMLGLSDSDLFLGAGVEVTLCYCSTSQSDHSCSPEAHLRATSSVGT